ncbi:mnr-1, partial [Pristionchus pacificus]|uniref:Uncharacterized protein n=1 Tax=Pristionchus pacificus TaxID=54126 RepID=A0A8R1Z5Y6_PRIPA
SRFPYDATMIFITLSIFSLLGGLYATAGFRDARATRMSVVDFWKNETLGDGLNLRVAHGVNSWPALVEQLQEPFLNKSMLLEGDVFLQNHRRPRHRAIPVMSPSARAADRMTFKEWLREVASLRKAIKINFRSTDVVHPVLEYLHAAQFDPSSPVLDYPLILHADVFRSYKSIESAVDPSVFVSNTENLFPDATLSLGWTKQANFTLVDEKHKRISWRQLMHILEYVARLDQPVMLSVRLTVAANSKEQLLWLLGMDKQVSLLIWSDDHDEVDDWKPIFDLRRMATKNRVLYDLLEKHRDILQRESADPIENPPTFSMESWRAVVFSSSSTDLSTVVMSARGPAFLGKPTALLLSHAHPQAFPGEQKIRGKVHFLPKKTGKGAEVDEESGVVIYLVDKIHDLQSPRVDDAIEVFIGYDGRVSIEKKMRRSNMKNKSSETYYDTKATGQAEKSHCYEFTVTDAGWRVSAEVLPVSCSDEKARGKRSLLDLPYLKGLSSLPYLDETDAPPSAYIQLETPLTRSRTLRSVAISKRGDPSVDFLLDRLEHSSCARLSFFVSIILLITVFFSR